MLSRLQRPTTRYAAKHLAAWPSVQSGTHRGALQARLQSTSREVAPLKTISIKSWDAIGSPADAYAVIRAVERRYGRLQEYRVWRDSERPQILQTNIIGVFRSPESFLKVPADGEVLHVPAPQVDPGRDGGIGLDDLEGLLAPQDVEEEEELPGWQSVMSRILQSDQEEASSRVIDVKVERAGRNWQNPSSVESTLPTRMRLRATGHAFLQWGGFYDRHLEPTEMTTTTLSSDASELPSHLPASTLQSDHGRMGEALAKWTRFLGRSDAELETLSATSSNSLAQESADEVPFDTTSSGIDSRGTTDPLLEWEPLPEVPLPVDANDGARTSDPVVTDEAVFGADLAWSSMPRQDSQPATATPDDGTRMDRGRGEKAD